MTNLSVRMFGQFLRYFTHFIDPPKKHFSGQKIRFRLYYLFLVSRFKSLEITVTRSTPEREQDAENMNMERAIPTDTQSNDTTSDDNTRAVTTRASTVTTHTQVSLVCELFPMQNLDYLNSLGPN